jgi:DNA-directed RNA polymerase II subunit RPB2
MTGVNKTTQNATKVLRENIVNDFLPHVGKNYRRKALYLGYMIRKMIRIYLGYDSYDNRDSYMNKRIDSPGILLSNLFRQCYGKMTKEIKGLIERELNLWRANYNNTTTDIINDNNIHLYINQSLLDSWLKYSLSTGNWGIKSIGSFQNIRQGVSQVLNRMSYASTLSHLRRISTSMEKNGKLVQPRKLDNSQFNMICPAETPEGASVGLVKNLALSTIISISMSSIHIRQLLVELGTVIYDDSYSYVNDNTDKWYIENDTVKEAKEKIANFFKELGNSNNVYIQINGDIIGYHNNPSDLYNKLKHYKRCGIIYPMTSVYWNILKRCICISTDAGRMYRPLLIVDYDHDNNKCELRIKKILREKKLTWSEFIKGKSFDDFICPNNTEDEEGFIEYLDNNELNHTLIAINYLDLDKGMKGNSYPPRYTNCEIHASLMNGILGVNIPFSDHNQSPRNCYQCLNENEKVLMSNGDYKLIKNISPNDEIICFNPITNVLNKSKVVYHYHMLTSKIVYNI